MTELPHHAKSPTIPMARPILIRRLVTEQGLIYWRRYLPAFALMAVSAGDHGGLGLSARRGHQSGLCGQERPRHRHSVGVTVVLLCVKGAATYGHTVILSKISNAILANNQRRLFAKLMSESVGFFSERHSSEFLARLTAGATSVTQVLSLLINAVGRDLLPLIAWSS